MLTLRVSAALLILVTAASVVLCENAPVAAVEPAPVQVWTKAELGTLKAGLKLTWTHDTGVTIAGKPLVKTQTLELTGVDGDTLSWQVTREIVSVEGETVRRENHVLKLEGTAAEFVEEAALRTLPDASQAKTGTALLTISAKAVACSLVTHTTKDDAGAEVVQKWWFCKDKPGVCARYERAVAGTVRESLTLTAMPQ
ncbi:MAG: hypothetical protein HS108_01970 [Planctomycetes bacterium]|jgi:hypothetical protein|nr:hypothetical protein [Planctomycetota bacterium]MCL4731752.1 hypothetical protein [Planctomycetota bacterium]